MAGSSVHVMWAQPYQPLTRYYCQHREKWVRTKPRKVYRCHECRDWRWAKYLKISVEYDYITILCADGCYGENRNHKRGKRWQGVSAS